MENMPKCSECNRKSTVSAQADAAQKQKNISAESLIDMLIITGKRLRECGEEEKAAMQFKIAQKIMDAFADDFVESKWFESTIFEYTMKQRKETEKLLGE